MNPEDRRCTAGRMVGMLHRGLKGPYQPNTDCPHSQKKNEGKKKSVSDTEVILGDAEKKKKMKEKGSSPH